MSKYRILSLDGGGIRGLLTAVLLQRLDEALPGWRDQLDLAAGTSTGGIIALGLAAGQTPAAIRDMYYHKGSRIFQDSTLDNVLDVGNSLGAQYDTHNLRIELEHVFGDLTIGQLPIRVLIPAFDLDNEAPEPNRMWSPKFFHNFITSDSDNQQRLVDVALYTTAAPSYFPTVDGFIDGGVVANNPSMAALAQTQDDRCDDRCPSIGQIRLLSLGSGHIHQYVASHNRPLDWGWTQWARPIIDIMMDGLEGIADYQCRQILGERRYHRVTPHLPFDMSLDEWQRRDQLVAEAEAVDLTPTIDWIEKYWLQD